MTENKEPLAFISYRRNDTAAAALWLNRTIAQTFGVSRVFTDTQTIRVATNWKESIQTALAKCTVLVVVIGPHWLSLTDEFGKRRIDHEDDWVRIEIKYALQHGIPLILILINTPLPSPRGLPSEIVGMLDFQAFSLTEERWESDLAYLLSVLENLGFKRTGPPPIKYPTPHVSIAELSSVDLERATAALTGWIVITTSLESQESLTRTELHKRFEFESFERAIEFMVEVRPFITRLQHHPRWENTWRTVSVWLSTWDIGHKISALDIQLAELIEKAYKDFRSSQ